MEERAIIIRGLPGSGKTTLANKLASIIPNSEVIEADQFFMVDGEYKFDPTRIKEAHEDCRRRFNKCLKKGGIPIVSNTSSRYWEMEYYLEIDNVIVFRCIGSYGSVHGVPEEAIQRMSERFENYVGEILVT